MAKKNTTAALRISPDLSLPIDAVTSTLVVYGGKGMGKTNLGTVLVEELAHAGMRFSVVDPMGVFWGLRHDADGKGLGIKVLILGGIHGDLPITPESGSLVADLVVDEDASVIIDISRRADGSMWAISERIRFVTDYAKRIYQRQGESRRPIHQVFDEAARFAPQVVRQGELEVAKCMGAIAVLVEEGRNVGIGVTLLTQRSARLNKDVAELADGMIAFRIVGPNSMRAVLDWLGEYVEKSRIKDISESLRKLPRGSALVVSPGWLEFEGIVAMRKRTTFDSSKTPEAGKQVRASGAGATLDLGKYRDRFAELIDHQKANDPKALKARVAELEKQLAGKAPPAPKAEIKIVEKPIITEKQIARLEAAAAAGAKASDAFRAAAAEIAGERCAPVAPKTFRLTVGGGRELGPQPRMEIRSGTGGSPPSKPKAVVRPASAASDGVLTGPQKALLEALMWWRHMGHLRPTKSMLAAKAGWRPKGSNLRNRLSELRVFGAVEVHGDIITLTNAGLGLAPAPDLGDTVVASIRRQLTGPQLQLFDKICDSADRMTRTELAESVGWDPAGSNLRNRLSELRTLSVLDPDKNLISLQSWVTA